MEQEQTRPERAAGDTPAAPHGSEDGGTLEERTRALLEAIHGGSATPPAPRTTAAQSLCVRVVEDGRVKASVKMPARVVENLADVIPEDIVPKLEARGIDVDTLAADAMANGCLPGELFRLDTETKQISVWLE